MALYDPALESLKTRLENQIARTEKNLTTLREQLSGVNKLIESTINIPKK